MRKGNGKWEAVGGWREEKGRGVRDEGRGVDHISGFDSSRYGFEIGSLGRKMGSFFGGFGKATSWFSLLVVVFNGVMKLVDRQEFGFVPSKKIFCNARSLSAGARCRPASIMG